MGRGFAYILPLAFGAVLLFLTPEAEMSDGDGVTIVVLPAAATGALAAVGRPGTLGRGEQP